jgi:hypothetical protein
MYYELGVMTASLLILSENGTNAHNNLAHHMW